MNSNEIYTFNLDVRCNCSSVQRFLLKVDGFPFELYVTTNFF